MLLLRCTGRLLSIIGGRSGPTLNSQAPASDADFYANLLWIDGRKCLLITHARTLFSVFVSDIRAADLRPIGAFIVPAISDALASEGLSKETFGHLDADEVELAKTASRSVLGSMNDLAFQCEMRVLDDGGARQVDLHKLNSEIRRIPMGSLGYAFPIELARAAQPGPNDVSRVPLLRLVQDGEGD
jgi:hypothetical protein